MAKHSMAVDCTSYHNATHIGRLCNEVGIIVVDVQNYTIAYIEHRYYFDES